MREFDKTVTQKAAEAESKLDKLRHDSAAKFEETKKTTGKELKREVDAFDQTVERKASEAKSGLSSWFGFGK